MAERYVVVWDGERIIDGEPEWFSEAASCGRISRPADGCGNVLFVQAKTGQQDVAFPGDRIAISPAGAMYIYKTNASAAEKMREKAAFIGLKIIK